MKMFKKVVEFVKENCKAIMAVFGGAAVLSNATPAQAAITWDFAGITGEMGGLGTALVAAGGIAIAGGLVVYGLYRAVGFVLRIFGKTTSK